MPDRPRFQYSLRSLLWLMTGFAVLCSVVATCPMAYRRLLWDVVDRVATVALVIGGTFIGVVMAIDVVSWFKTPHADADSLAKKVKLLLRSGPFWIVICVALPLVIGLNLLPYYFSYRAYEFDGVERMGWPLPFYECGGIEGFDRRSTAVFCIDILIAGVSSLTYCWGQPPQRHWTGSYECPQVASHDPHMAERRRKPARVRGQLTALQLCGDRNWDAGSFSGDRNWGGSQLGRR